MITKLHLTTNQGFSLIEMLIAMTVLGIVSSIAYPLFQSSIISNRLLAQTNQVMASFSYARAEAMRRGDFVSVCATSDGATCDAANDVSKGLIIFNNPSQSGLAANSQIIRVYDKWTNNDKGKITATGYITFNAAGSSTSASSILVCKPGSDSFTLQVSSIGKLQVNSNVGDGGC